MVARTLRPRAARGLLGLLVAGLLAASGCQSDAPRISRAELDALAQKPAEPAAAFTPRDLGLAEQKPYALAAGDVLSLTLTGLTAPSTATVIRTRIHDNGNIALPLVGRVPVSGLTLATAEQRVLEAYVPQYIKDLTVFAELVDPNEISVVVAGAAAAGGLISLPRDECNVVHAVARAAGFGATASGRVRVLPIEPSRPETVYDLTAVADLRRALTAPPLQSGDLVFVEAAGTSAVYLTGLVNVPGPIPVPPHGKMSLVQALAAAGGVRDFLEPKDATLWRTLPDGQRVRVQLDVNEILAGRDEDILLAAGDVVQIPHTLDTRFREWVAANLRVGPFGVGVQYDALQQYNFQRALDDTDDGGFGRTITDSLRFGLQNSLNQSLIGGATAKPSKP